MGDVGKGSSVNESRVAFQSLGDVREEGLPKKQGHGPGSTDVTGFDWMAFGGGADHDVPETASKVSIIGGEDKNGHHLTGCCDVKPIFSHLAVRRTSHPDGDVAKSTVVHVDDSGP